MENKLQDGDIRGAFRVLISEEAIAPPDDATLQILGEKRPSPSAANFSSAFEDLPNVPEITPIEDLYAVRSFPNGSSGGIDGMKPQHLKDSLAASNGDIARRLCEKLIEVLNVKLKGDIPPDLAPFFFEAIVTPSMKKDGDVRPIARDSVFRRIICKVISVRVHKQMRDLLGPKTA